MKTLEVLDLVLRGKRLKPKSQSGRMLRKGGSAFYAKGSGRERKGREK